MSSIQLSVQAPSSALECLRSIPTLSHVLSMAHAEAIRRVLVANSTKEADMASKDVREVLEAQVNLVAIELYLHNKNLDESTPKLAPTLSTNE